VAPYGWGNPAGRVGTRPPALYSPWRELGMVHAHVGVAERTGDTTKLFGF